MHALLGGLRGGYFVDLAANEPVRISNTRALERDYGWSGVCVEPNPMYWDALRRHRRCSVETRPVSNESRSTLLISRGVFSSLAPSDGRQEASQKRLATQTVRFDELLDRIGAPSVLDYLSLDVEGSELAAMLSFPWASRKIRVLTVERPVRALQKLLRSHGLHFVCNSGRFGDQLWVTASLLPRVPDCGAPTVGSRCRWRNASSDGALADCRPPACAVTTAGPLDASANQPRGFEGRWVAEPCYTPSMRRHDPHHQQAKALERSSHTQDL